MMPRRLFALAVAGLMAVAMTLGMVSTALAGDAGETVTLFRSAGARQSAQDFKPAPDKIQTGFGCHGSSPTV